MRIALGLVSLTGLLAACMSDPHLELFEGSDPTTRTSPALPAAPGTERDASGPDSGEASTADATPPVDDDASVPPPPAAVCPPAGAPSGTKCCGANGAAPPCFGMACEHCGDCVSLGCASGMICCAVSPGNSGKYKSMSCRAAALAGTCPTSDDHQD